jgi:N4-gp56 family major capsid protein|nr:MAG TPA: major capsid protein [Caudoviricetes sp.]
MKTDIRKLNKAMAAVMMLQMFADPNTNVTTDAGMSVENKTFYDKELIRTAGPQLVHDQFAQKRPIPKNGGQTIEFRQFAELPKALTPLTEGVTPNGKKLSATAKTATVSQYGDYVTISDKLDLTAIDPVALEAVDVIGKQMGLTLDTVTRNKLQQGLQVMYAPLRVGDTETEVSSRSKLDTSSVLTVKLVQQARTELKAMNVPTFDDGCYVMIIHPYAAYDLKRDPEWRKPHEYADTRELYNGEIGMVDGVRFVETSEAKIYCGEDLASDSRTLKVNGAVSSAGKTINFNGGTVKANALAGRYVLIGDNRVKVTSNTASALTLETAITAEDKATIYPGEGGAKGGAVFGNLIFGKNAYGVTEIEGGGAETIIKPKGSAGTADPLNQRSTVGWKAIKTAEILVDFYMMRVETGSAYSTRIHEAN